MLQPNSLAPKNVLTQFFGFDLSANDSRLMAEIMNSEDLKSNLIEIASQLLEKSKVGRVNWQTVLTTDIQCSNGVIHVIDSVLLPE